MRVRLGRPISMERFGDQTRNRLVLREITDELMYEIRELSGQEYVDTYATKQADALPAETGRIPVAAVG